MGPSILNRKASTVSIMIISAAPGANRAQLINSLRFIKGVGPSIAKRIADGERLMLDLIPAARAEMTRVMDSGLIEFSLPNGDEVPVVPVEAEDSVPVEADDDESGDVDVDLLKRLLSKKGISEKRVIELIREHSVRPAHVKITMIGPGIDLRGEAVMHHRFPLLVTAIASRVNVMLVGPAGSGKTTAAVKAAEALGLSFYGTGAINSEYKLMGFIDAQGRIVSTAFRQAFEHGGLFLFDEMDASLPSALLAFNSALANDWVDFPDKCVKRHPDFCPVGGTNTFGTGADRQYVGRNQLDAASIDRWATLDWGYDEALEASLVGAPAPKGAPVPPTIVPLPAVEVEGLSHRFLERVRKVRAAVDVLKVRHVVSPRATISGSKLLAAGWAWNDVENAVIWKGLDADTRAKVSAKAN